MVDKNTKIAAGLSVLPFGQFFGRVFYLNGSLDKWWLLIPIFYIFPFCLVPVIMILLGLVKKGKGGKPYDKYIYVPMVMIAITKLISFTRLGNYRAVKLISALLIFGSITLILLYRRNKLIKDTSKKEDNCDSTYSPKVITNTIVDSLGLYIITLFLLLIVKFIIFVVMLRSGKIRANSIANKAIDLLLFPLALWCVYVFNNMMNQNNIKDVCNPKWFYESKFKIVLFVFSIIYGLINIYTASKDMSISSVQNFKKPNLKSLNIDSNILRKLINMKNS